jgi:hypothetical protein
LRTTSLWDFTLPNPIPVRHITICLRPAAKLNFQTPNTRQRMGCRLSCIGLGNNRERHVLVLRLTPAHGVSRRPAPGAGCALRLCIRSGGYLSVILAMSTELQRTLVFRAHCGGRQKVNASASDSRRCPICHCRFDGLCMGEQVPVLRPGRAS